MDATKARQNERRKSAPRGMQEKYAKMDAGKARQNMLMKKCAKMDVGKAHQNELRKSATKWVNEKARQNELRKSAQKWVQAKARQNKEDIRTSQDDSCYTFNFILLLILRLSNPRRISNNSGCLPVILVVCLSLCSSPSTSSVRPCI